MSTLRITLNVKTSTKKFLKLSNKMLVDPTRIAYLKQMRKPAGGAQIGQTRGWEVGGLNGLADAQFLIISDEVAQGLREDLAMTEVFDDQYKVSNVRAKLEGKPQNKLAEAIAEGRVEADKLYEKLKSSGDVITQALQKNQIGIMGGFLGRVGTSDAENLQTQFQNDIAGIKARNLPEDQMQDLIKKRVEQLSDDSTKGLSSLPTKKAPWWAMGYGGTDTEALKSDFNIIR